MNFVQTETLPHLLCVTCKKILSQFPIYCHSEGPTCGRCPYPQNGIRNEAYEAIAQKLKFPCSHNENGCLENLFPKEVEKHEQNCRFRKYDCPIMSPNCEWKGFSKDLLDHVETNHSMFLLSENFFEVDFINSHNENYLLPYGEDLFLVNRRTESKRHIFFCTVSLIGNSVMSDEKIFKIILENSNKSHTHEMCARINTTIQIEKHILANLLNDPVSIVAKIEVFQKEVIADNDKEEDINHKINFELLRELECLVCMEYMIPPIYQCMTGHSICQKCKESIQECPNCKQEYKNTQNYALAQVINHIEYPCKYSRCKFISKAKDIKQHEATCVFAPYPCPLKEYVICNDELQFDNLYDHIVHNHYENLLEVDVVSIPFDFDTDDRIDDCFIIKYDSRLFKLHFFFSDEFFNFAVQFVGPTEQSSKYGFEIDIIDMSGRNQRVYFTRSCGPSTDKSAAFAEGKEYICLDLQQIEHLISDQLCFRVRVNNK